MQSFTIVANGTEMGSYEAETKREAIEAYVRDAGYDSIGQAAEALSKGEDAFLAEIEVR